MIRLLTLALLLLTSAAYAGQGMGPGPGARTYAAAAPTDYTNFHTGLNGWTLIGGTTYTTGGVVPASEGYVSFDSNVGDGAVSKTVVTPAGTMSFWANTSGLPYITVSAGGPVSFTTSTVSGTWTKCSAATIAGSSIITIGTSFDNYDESVQITDITLPL